MKIVVFDLEPWERDAFEHLRERQEVICTSEELDETTAKKYADADAVSVFIYSQVSREILQAFSQLKLIATRSTGIDHIDAVACDEAGIAICNVPQYGENTVAEHVFALLLAVSHRMVEAVDRTRRGDFSPRGLQGFDLAGKTMGVVGTGTIGANVCRIARGFQMRVLAFDVKPREDLARELGFEYVALDDLLGRAHVISLHTPASPKTEHLIDQAAFAKMQPGTVLINTARGSVVEIHALIEALASGKLGGAGLDVLPDEPVIREEAELLRSIYERQHNLDALLADNVLPRLPNVVVTPHSAFKTREAVQRILDVTVENLAAFDRQEPRNIVRPAA